jgi:hypothetical protein
MPVPLAAGAAAAAPAAAGGIGAAIAGINPFVGGSLIVAGTSLLSGILGGLSETERRKREMLMQANQQAFDAKSKSAENLAKNKKDAFGQLMETYKNALL